MRSGMRFTGFNSHPRLEGTHAFLSPSKYHWLNYDEEKLLERYKAAGAAARGNSLHALAEHAIREGVELDEQSEEHHALALYVNDAIRFGMTPEQPLFYSFNCYGIADAICFEEVKLFLRIHDFKSGTAPTSEKQLYIYAALFCLEYGIGPYELTGELRIYQTDEVRKFVIDQNFLAYVHDKIITHDAKIEEKRREGLL